MKTGVAGFVAVVILLAPVAASAQVVISEVMYNPKGSNTSRQWIELQNAGASDVTMVAGTGSCTKCWKVSDGSNHNLVDPASGVGRGSLVIPAGAFVVIASDPTTFVGEYPGVDYSVVKSAISLSSTAATISVTNDSAVKVDQFAYTKDLGANDDGNSLQRTSGGSWIAALPTPGAANAETAYVPPDTSGTNSDTSASSTSQTQTQTQTQAPLPAVSSYVPPPLPTVFADAGGDRTVIVGADVEFDGRAYNRDKEMLDHVRLVWNFGDGATGEGPAVTHHFDYPGRYVVVLDVAHDKTDVSDQVIVTAEPAKLSFASLPDGSVSIENHAGHDLNLSGWIIKQLGREFALAENSIILAGSAMHISEKTLGVYANKDAQLEYPNGVVALHAGESSPNSSATPLSPVAIAPSPPPLSPVPVRVPNVRHAPEIPAPVPDDTSELPSDATTTATTSGQVAAAGAASSRMIIWWLVAGGLAVAAATTLVVAKHFGKGEWTIVDESAE